MAAIAASAAAARADLASLDYGDGDDSWLPPGRRGRAWLIAERQGDVARFDAPEDNLEQALLFLAERRSEVPRGAFVFVLSDFLVAPSGAAWQQALARGWDLVPVVIQDPVWERGFPDVAGVAVFVADPRSGEVSVVRLSRRRVRRRREANEARYHALLVELQSFGLQPVAIESSDPAAYQNFDETGQHTPGPDPDAVRFLLHERDVLGFGTETIGTDAGQAAHFLPPSIRGR